MKDIYYPRTSSAADLSGFVVLIPDTYDKAKTYIWRLCVHGIGERGAGTEELLRNLVYGPVINGVRRSEWAFVNDDMKKAVDLYNIILVVPNYYTTEFFEPAKALYIYNFMLANYTVTGKFIYDGFSYGGGSTVKSASTLEVAKKIIVAIPAAPTANVVSWKNLVDAKVPIHFFVNDNDDNYATNLSVTQKMVNDINALNPVIPAKFTAFRQDGHGGYNQMISLTPPTSTTLVKGSVNNLAENTWQWAIDVYNNGPRLMKTGTIVTPPVEPPTTAVKAITSYKITGNQISLIGSKSTGYTIGYDGTWALKSGPATAKQVFPTGSSYIDATGILPVPGTYVFTFSLKGALPVDVTVQHGDVVAPKVPKVFDWATKMLSYEDGTKEAVTSAKFIAASGLIYEL